MELLEPGRNILGPKTTHLERLTALKPGIRVVITVPAIQTTSGLKKLNREVISNIENRGFSLINTDPLIDSRPDQIVNREILIFERI